VARGLGFPEDAAYDTRMSEMLFALNQIDYGVLGLYLVVMVLIGLHFSREQRSSKDFFLAGRTMTWFPIGLSVMATLLSALSYTGVPGEAYYHGLKLLLLPIGIWLTLPIMAKFFLPLYQGLRLYSVYEYLELRFDAPTRLVSSLVFIVWRLLWMGGVMYAPCKVLVVAAGLDVPMWLLLVMLGVVGTAYTYLGGIKAVIWTDVIQALVMFGGLVLIIGGVWWSLDGGANRVWETTVALERNQVTDFTFSWSDKWCVWGALPHFVLAVLSFYVADQITAQRFLTAKDVPTARRSFVLNCVSVSFMGPALLYVGLCMLAFYQNNPQSMRPIWVTNVDNATGQSLTFPDTRERPLIDPKTGEPKKSMTTGEVILDPTDGKPLIAWDEDRLDASTIEELVEQGRVLRPNSKEPYAEAEGLVDPQTERLDIDKLAMRSGDEVILHQRAQDELMPRFITEHLPLGIAGLILAALFAASMSSMDSGLNSICTLFITDFHRRLGIGRSWLAAKVDKPEESLGEEDELKLGRPLVLVIGIAATVFSLIVAQIGDIFSIMIAVVNTFGGPLLAIFLLGVFTRRCTARAALVSLVAGTLFTIWITVANSYTAFVWLWPFGERLASIWSVTFGVGFTLVFGYAASFFIGNRKPKDQLRGLVVGVGQLGNREPEEMEVIVIEPPADSDGER